MLHYALNTNYVGSYLYFATFHLITVLIIFSVITGLVWEIFNMLDEKTKEVLAEHQERENENIQRIKEKNTFKHETFHRQKTITQAKRNTRRISIMSELAEENSQKSESCSSKYSKQLSAENKSKESHSDAVKNDEVEENNESSVEKLEVKDLYIYIYKACTNATLCIKYKLCGKLSIFCNLPFDNSADNFFSDHRACLGDFQYA